MPGPLAGAIPAFLTTAVCAAAAQQSTPAQPTFKASTRVVTVNVVVTEKSDCNFLTGCKQGEAVRGLTAEDFVLLDNGRPQAIKFFSPIENASAQSPKLPPDTFANVTQQKGALPSATALLFDTQNSDWVSQAYALHRIRMFLRQLQPADHIGLYVLGNHGLEILHDFDQDSTELIEAVRWYDQQHTLPKEQRKKITGNPHLDALHDFVLGKDNSLNVSSEQDRSQPPVALRTSRGTSEVLLAVARHLSSVPGRKALIWMSDRLPGELLTSKDAFAIAVSQGNRPQVEHHGAAAFLLGGHGLNGVNHYAEMVASGRDLVPALVRLFNDAGIAVYPVSSEGLQAFDLGLSGPAFDLGPGFQQPASLQSLGLGNYTLDDPNSDVNNAPRFPLDWPHVDMEELARRTGGRAFFNRNDLETGIRRALDDSRVSYELAYYPDHNKWNGEWHKLQVKLRKPGSSVLARAGYFALPEAKPIPSSESRNFLLRVAGSPIEATQVPLTVRINSHHEASFEVQVSFNPRTMLAEDASGNWKGSFEILYFVVKDNGRVLSVPVQAYDLDLKPDTYQRVTQNGVTMKENVAAPPGAATLCVILHDKRSDIVGSVRIPLAEYLARK